MNLKIASHSWRRFAILLTLCLGLAGLNPAAASIIYDFSLPSNGSVGAVDIHESCAAYYAIGRAFDCREDRSKPFTPGHIETIKELLQAAAQRYE